MPKIEGDDKMTLKFAEIAHILSQEGIEKEFFWEIMKTQGYFRVLPNQDSTNVSFIQTISTIIIDM